MIACGADAGNGTYALACAMGDNSGLGSCDVVQLDAGRASLCVAGGTSDGGCDPINANRREPGGLCQPGYLCYAPSTANTGTCIQLCDGVTTSCPMGKSCKLKFTTPPYNGYCQ